MKEPTVLTHFTAYFSNTFETNAHLDAQRRLITSRPTPLLQNRQCGIHDIINRETEELEQLRCGC